MKYCLHLHNMQGMILYLCIINKYHCKYDIYNAPGLVFISLGYNEHFVNVYDQC